MPAPDPLTNFEDYVLWCECHACPACEGLGSDDIEDPHDPDYPHWECGFCNGTGIEPGAEDECDE